MAHCRKLRRWRIGLRPIMLVSEVTAHLDYDRYRHFTVWPGVGYWDKDPAPTGSSRREFYTMHIRVIWRGRVLPSRVAVSQCKQLTQKAVGKDGASSRGKTITARGLLFIRPKACVAGQSSLWWNPLAQRSEMLKKPSVLGLEEDCGTNREAVKCVDPVGTICGEGDSLVQVRRSCTKARVAKRIRYPCSPGRKRCPLSVAVYFWHRGAVAKALKGPPGDYGRKAET